MTQIIALIILAVAAYVAVMTWLWPRPARPASTGLLRCPGCSTAGFRRADGRVTWLRYGCWTGGFDGGSDVVTWHWRRHPQGGVT